MHVGHSMRDRPQRGRFAFLDLVRFLSVLTIVPFHFLEFGFDTETHPVYAQSVLNLFFFNYAKLLPFSGHTIVMLSLFLLGYGNLGLIKTLRLLGGCILGYFVLWTSYFGDVNQIVYWDVYSFHFIVIILAYASLQIPNGIFLSLFLAIATSSPQILRFESEIVGGICRPDLKTAWPILPWCFYASFFCNLGQELRLQRISWLSNLSDLIHKNIKFLILGIVASWPLLAGGIFEMHPPSGMYCFYQEFSIFRKFFLMAFLAVIFIYGVNKKSIETWKKSAFAVISHSAWNENLYLAYLVHLLIIGLFTSFDEIFMSSPLRYDLSLVMIFVFTEVFTKIILQSKNYFFSRNESSRQ